VLSSGKRTVLLRNATDARYVPPGRLLFMRLGTLFAVGFDPGKLELKGEQVALIEGVAQALTSRNTNDITGTGQLAVSPAGDLAYIPSPAVQFEQSRLVAVDHTGRVEPLPAPARSFETWVEASRDGRKLAVAINSMTEYRIWIYDMTRQTLTPLTPPGGEFTDPRWSPDGRRVAFRSLQSGIATVGWQWADGSAPPETLALEDLEPSSWSPDGGELAGFSWANQDIWVLNLDGRSPRLRPLLQSPAREGWPSFSPDGNWLLYGSDASGSFEAYLQPYPGPGPRLQVSVDGGGVPTWNPNGREIFFLATTPTSGRWRMMSVSVALGATPQIGTSRQLFDFDGQQLNFWDFPLTGYSVSPDGQRFFTTKPVKTDPPPPVTHINLVLNWRAELEAKVPSGL